MEGPARDAKKALIKNDLRQFDCVGDVRGMGLMAAVEFVKNKATKQPFDPPHEAPNTICDLAWKRGCLYASHHGSRWLGPAADYFAEITGPDGFGTRISDSVD